MRKNDGKVISAEEVVQIAEPSVVRVQTGTGFATGVGTGFIVDPDGYIMTNNHVVQGARGRAGVGGIKVTLSDGAEYDAAIIGTDPRSDLALIKIEAKGLSALPIGTLENVQVGQDVLAIGFALDLQEGTGAPTVTRGIISAKNRSISENTQVLGAIQTDAAINHGNSGGPLLNFYGEVVGVNTAIAPDDTTGGVAPGIGFAVGADTVQAVFQQLKTDGKVSRGYLGIGNFVELRPAKAQELGIPGGTRGVYLVNPDTTTGMRSTIPTVLQGAPADQAGIRPGDVITKIGDTRVGDESELAVAMINHHPGQKVRVELYREGKAMTVEVTLGTPPNQ